MNPRPRFPAAPRRPAAAPATPGIRAATAAAMMTVAGVMLLSACASQTPPSAPQVTPLNATIKLGRVTEKTFLTRVDVTDTASYGGYGVGVGAAGVGGGGGGGGGVGMGFSIDLTRLFNRQPPQQVDLFQYKVLASDGTVASVNAPAAPGLEPGTCVRLVYPDGAVQPQMGPSNEC